MTTLRNVIVEILASRDFEVFDVEGYLQARRDGVRVAFCLLSATSPNTLEDFISRFREFQGRKVVATLDSVPGPFPDFVDQSCYIWDREAIEHEIGRMRVESILGERDHGFVDELSADDFPRMVSYEDLDRFETPDVMEYIVRPILELRDVKRISRQTVGGYRHRLELVPYYVYMYQCALAIDGNRLGFSTGRIAVNAITRKVETWSHDVEVVEEIDLSHRKMDPTLALAEATSLAREEIVRAHTYEREVTWNNEAAVVTEKRRFHPDHEDILLSEMGVYYLPVWCVEGVNGMMSINAGTGKIISENYYRR